MRSKKLIVLDEVNKKLVDFQKSMKIQMEYSDGTMSSFDLLEEENVWVHDGEFGPGSRYKTMKQFNKTGEHNLAPVLFEGKEGNLVDTHSHREAHLFICVEGKVEVTLDDNDTYTIGSSESIYINSFQPHRFLFLEDSKLIITVINI